MTGAMATTTTRTEYRVMVKYPGRKRFERNYSSGFRGRDREAVDRAIAWHAARYPNIEYRVEQREIVTTIHPWKPVSR